MRMEKWRFVSMTLLLSLFITSAMAIILMPIRVLIHFNIFVKLDFASSKYIFIVYPLIAFVFWCIMFFVTKMFVKKGMEKSAKVVSILTCLVLLLIMSIEVYSIIYAYQYPINSISTIKPISLYQLVFIVISMIYATIVLLLPKLSKNRFIGIRTFSSMCND